MKKQLLRIHLYIDYIDGNPKIEERHTIFEVFKETAYRYYYKETDLMSQRTILRYFEKKNYQSVIGNVEFVKIENTDKFKVICNLSVLCEPKQKDDYQSIIRKAMITKSEQMRDSVVNIEHIVSKFCSMYAHEEILSTETPYIKLTKDSKITNPKKQIT